MFFEQLGNGLALGSIYALTAIGFTMVYGIIGLINFAHGDIYMMGAFFALTALTVLQLPLLPAFVFGMVGAALLGVLMSRIAYKPLFKAARINLFLCAIGAAIFLENYAMLTWGPQTNSFPPVFTNTNFQMLGMNVSSLQLFILGISVVFMSGLTILVTKTKIGRAMRSTAQDMDTARLMGVNTDRIVYLTFAIGSALGAAAGILVGMYYKAVFPMMGFMPGLKAFSAAVLGGIGSIPGAMLGGMLLGVAESMGAAYISSGFRDGIAFIVLILVLLLRPAGLLGKNQQDKV
ncbi:MAG: branched-chain amino acid ABC transporter permease [Bacillota bacterium]|nr:branched-chain amino acid ABC transporter permease [Bacillota bacterium]